MIKLMNWDYRRWNEAVKSSVPLCGGDVVDDIFWLFSRMSTLVHLSVYSQQFLHSRRCYFNDSLWCCRVLRRPWNRWNALRKTIRIWRTIGTTPTAIIACVLERLSMVDTTSTATRVRESFLTWSEPETYPELIKKWLSRSYEITKSCKYLQVQVGLWTGPHRILDYLHSEI